MVGGCRNAGDEARVNKLRKLCCDLGLESSVEFKLNLPSVVRDLLGLFPFLIYLEKRLLNDFFSGWTFFWMTFLFGDLGLVPG